MADGGGKLKPRTEPIAGMSSRRRAEPPRGTSTSTSTANYVRRRIV